QGQSPWDPKSHAFTSFATPAWLRCASTPRWAQYALGRGMGEAVVIIPLVPGSVKHGARKPSRAPAPSRIPKRAGACPRGRLVHGGGRAMARRRGLMSDALKYELAQELGFANKVRNGDWGEVTTREAGDRKSTRLNSSHVKRSYAVLCLKKK